MLINTTLFLQHLVNLLSHLSHYTWYESYFCKRVYQLLGTPFRKCPECHVLINMYFSYLTLTMSSSSRRTRKGHSFSPLRSILVKSDRPEPVGVFFSSQFFFNSSVPYHFVFCSFEVSSLEPI